MYSGFNAKNQGYTCTCTKCGDNFMGRKRDFSCASCTSILNQDNTNKLKNENEKLILKIQTLEKTIVNMAIAHEKAEKK